MGLNNIRTVADFLGVSDTWVRSLRRDNKLPCDDQGNFVLDAVVSYARERGKDAQAIDAFLARHANGAAAEDAIELPDRDTAVLVALTAYNNLKDEHEQLVEAHRHVVDRVTELDGQLAAAKGRVAELEAELTRAWEQIEELQDTRKQPQYSEAEQDALRKSGLFRRAS